MSLEGREGSRSAGQKECLSHEGRRRHKANALPCQHLVDGQPCLIYLHAISLSANAVPYHQKGSGDTGRMQCPSITRAAETQRRRVQCPDAVP